MGVPTILRLQSVNPGELFDTKAVFVPIHSRSKTHQIANDNVTI